MEVFLVVLLAVPLILSLIVSWMAMRAVLALIRRPR
jgi:hypothetical protein